MSSKFRYPQLQESHSKEQGKAINEFTTMKIILISFAVLSAIFCTAHAQNISRFPGFPSPSTGPTFPGFPGFPIGPLPGPSSGPNFPSLPGTSTGPTFPRPSPFIHRLRRSPQGSISLEAMKPLGGPDRHSSIDVNYNHRVIDNPKTTLDAFGGANIYRGQTSPHGGLRFEHNINKDLFVHGHGQVQPGPRGGLSPSFGAGLGWRFRREAMTYEAPEEEVAEEIY